MNLQRTLLAVVRGGYRKTNVNININNSINIGGGRNRPETRPNVYNRPENRDRNVDRPAGSSNRQARPVADGRNNVLTDRSGNVYQRNDNQRQNGQWQQPGNMDRASSPTAGTRPSQPSTTRPSSSSIGNTGTRQASSYGSSRSSQQAVRPQLERDYSARQHGTQRSQSYQRQGGGRRRR